MKKLSLFAKIFIVLTVLTIVSGTLAAAFSQIAQRSDPKFIESTLNRINQNISKTKDHSEVREEEISKIKTLEFRSLTGDISVESYNGSTLKVEYAGKIPDNETGVLTDVQTRGDVLSMDFMTPQNGRSSGVMFQWNDTMRGINFDGESDLSAHILVPRNFQGSIVVKSTSGDVELTNLILENASVASVSGDIELKHSQFKAVFAKTVSGEISADHCDALTWQVQSTSGDVELELNNIQGLQTELTSNTGGITVDPQIKPTTGKAERFVTVKTVTGGIELSPSKDD